MKPADALRVAGAPWQAAKVPEITGTGVGLICTLALAEAVHPPLAVTVTV